MKSMVQHNPLDRHIRSSLLCSIPLSEHCRPEGWYWQVKEFTEIFEDRNDNNPQVKDPIWIMIRYGGFLNGLIQAPNKCVSSTYTKSKYD